MGEKGMVPALIINATVACLCTDWFVNKIKYKKINVSWKETFNIAVPMVKVGVMLMLVGVIDSIVTVALSSYLRSKGGLDVVGFYHAGHTMVANYIGVIVASLVMDYYPRLSAVHDDNVKVADELNKQSKIGLLFVFPLASIFVFFTPQLLSILYTDKFSIVVQFTDFAIFGAILHVLSECLKMILIAKQDAGLYLSSSLIVRVIILPTYIILFTKFNIMGLGIAYFTDFLLRAVLFGVIVFKKYKVTIDKGTTLLFLATSCSAILMLIIRSIDIWYIKYSFGIVLICVVLCYTNYELKKFLGNSLIEIIKKKIVKKR